MFFDPNQHDPAQGAGQLPVGLKQPVVIESHSLKGSQAKQSNGYVELVLRVIDGPNAGRSGAERLNLVNESQTAVEIAHKKFSAYCHAVGFLQAMMSPDDIVNLYNKPFLVDVEQDPKDERYTNVTKVYDIGGNAPVFRQMPTQAAPATTSQGQPTNGWGNSPVAPAAVNAPNVAANVPMATAPLSPSESAAVVTTAWGQQSQASQPPAQATQAAPATTWAQQQAQATQAAPATGNAPVMGWGPR